MEDLYNLIPRDQLLEYIESNNRVINAIIKHRNNELLLESMSHIPVVILTKTRHKDIYISVCTDEEKRKELLLWWYNTQKFSGLRELSEVNKDFGFRRYPFYIHEPLSKFLGNRWKTGIRIQRNHRVYFVEDIAWYSAKSDELDFIEILDKTKRKYWSQIYTEDPDRYIDPEAYFHPKLNTLRIKQGICEDVDKDY